MDTGAKNYRRYLSGDDGGMEDLIREFKDPLTYFLLSYIRDPAEAEDLCEDVFVRLATKKPKFSGRSAFRTWLFAIGRNMAFDRLRKVQPLPIDGFGETAGTDDTAEKTVLSKERSQIIKEALASLKPEYRQVLYLLYFDGFSRDDTAAIMGKSGHRFDHLVSRARKSMKKALEKEGIVNEEL